MNDSTSIFQKIVSSDAINDIFLETLKKHNFCRS